MSWCPHRSPRPPVWWLGVRTAPPIILGVRTTPPIILGMHTAPMNLDSDDEYDDDDGDDGNDYDGDDIDVSILFSQLRCLG